MCSIYDIVERGQNGDNSAVEALSRMDWFRACIAESVDNVWKSYGGKMFADVYDNMDYDYIVTLLSFMVAKQTCTPSAGNDIKSRLDGVTSDTATKAYVRKYVRKGTFKGEWNKVFYSYAVEAHPSIGNNVAAFKRNMNVYTWFLSHTVTKADVDKTDEEIISSIDLSSIAKRYAVDATEDNPKTFGDVKKSMEKDLETLRVWFRSLDDVAYADADYNTQDYLDQVIDSEILSHFKEVLLRMRPIQRECYLRHIVYNVSGPKVADQLGISEASVRRNCEAVRKQLEEDLKTVTN